MPISVSAVVDCTNHVTASAEKLEKSRVPTNLLYLGIERLRKFMIKKKRFMYVERKRTDGEIIATSLYS